MPFISFPAVNRAWGERERVKEREREREKCGTGKALTQGWVWEKL